MRIGELAQSAAQTCNTGKMQVPGARRADPSLVHGLAIDAQPLAAVNSVEYLAVSKGILPSDAKLLSEVLLLGCGRIELCRLAQ